LIVLPNFGKLIVIVVYYWERIFMNKTNFSFVPTNPEPIQKIAPEVAASILQDISQEQIGWITPSSQHSSISQLKPKHCGA
jgi:hypothetical protein